jgi:hypothetical protein
MQYRTVRPEPLRQAQARLAKRVADRFPGSGLSEVAAELARVVDDAAVRAGQIRRPNWPLRAAVALVALVALGLGIRMATSVQLKSDVKDAPGLFQFVEAALQVCFFLGAVALFLVTLEVRMKRRRALAALHELRAMAHVVDMHQVAKDPEGLLRGQTSGPEAPKQTTKTPYDLNRYLNYCNELLSILSKVAALYVQDFPDGPTVAAADQVENLCTGLSQKIWQKIMVLDQLVGQREPGAAPRDGAPAGPHPPSPAPAPSAVS